VEEKNQSLNELKSELFEARRIEEYLRSEVKELWSHIKNLESLPLYKIWLKIANKIKREKSISPLSNTENVIHENLLEEFQIQKCDFLFIFSSDAHEIGGLKTSGRLARDIKNFDRKVALGLPLTHNPTSRNDDRFFVKETSLNDKTLISCIIACGSDTIEKSLELKKKYQSKLILLMMGLDQIFAPSWRESENYLKAIREADLVICLAPHLAKQANLYGAKHVVVAPLGFNNNEFHFTGVEKKNKILVPCRTSVEKGLKLLLPIIPLIRNEGWEVVGFGDLADHAQANVFDKFLGRIDPERLNNELQDAKYLIDPSWIEGLGLVALEAAACGTLPIITARGDYAELFTKGSEPFIEIKNFIDPQEILKVISENKNNLNPQEIVSKVSSLTWENGSKIARAELIKLTGI
jgi:glycosyltransferase involved in cell wall biosynthesis